MARKNNKPKRRRSPKGISILGVTETVLLLNVATNALFKTNVYEFLTAKKPANDGSDVITLRELINPSEGTFYNNPDLAGSGTRSYYIGRNLKNNWLTAAGMMIAIPVGFRVGKKLASNTINRSNRLLKQAGVASTVKI